MGGPYLSLWGWGWLLKFGRRELGNFPHLPLVPNPTPPNDGIVVFANGRVCATAQPNVRTAGRGRRALLLARENGLLECRLHEAR